VIFVEFTLDHPILREALSSVPEMTLRHERSDVDDDRIRALIWAAGGEFDAFEEAIGSDPTVGAHECVFDSGARRLYQIDLVGEGYAASVYPVIVREGSVIHDLTASSDGWRFSASFPSRAAFDRFYEFCCDREIDLELHRLYTPDAITDGASYELTDEQLEALVAAVERGYFEIPREASLEDVAAALGVSSNAASERLRRAMKALAERALCVEGESRGEAGWASGRDARR
jgi:predicted DNA binding protein